MVPRICTRWYASRCFAYLRTARGWTLGIGDTRRDAVRDAVRSARQPG